MLQPRPTVERVQVDKPMASDLTRTGHSHGDNGFEGTAFLLNQCKDKDLADPTDPGHTVFPYGGMIGRAAEIDDHLNPGRKVDTRTPASRCRFVC